MFVTHDQVEALTMCDRIAVMNCGRIEQVGSPDDIYERPATRFVAGFVGRANVLPRTRGARRAASRCRATELPEHEVAATRRSRAVRPAAADQDRSLPRSRSASRHGAADRPGRAAASSSATISKPSSQGADGELTVEMPSGEEPLPDGAEVAAVWKVGDMRVFAREAA